jgi:hypothetical protein
MCLISGVDLAAYPRRTAMKLECVQFWSTRDDVSINAVRDQLPANLRDQLIEDAYGIQVDASKSEAIEDIESSLRIGKTRDFVRCTYVEVDKSEIGNYSHFFVRPQPFGWKENAFFEVTERSCKADAMCRWGVRASSPVRVKSSKLKGLSEIAGPPMPQIKLLLVTRQVRELFDAEGITGLEYESCEDLDGISAPPFLATVGHRACQVGSDIVAKHCPEHRTMFGCFVVDMETPRDGLSDHDFLMIDRVNVDGRDYLYHYPLLVVSQKALTLLLKHKVRSLQQVTTLLNQKFRPLVM